MGAVNSKSPKDSFNCSKNSSSGTIGYERFTPEEVALLRDSFTKIIDNNREKLAEKICNAISENVEGAMLKYNENNFQPQNNSWSSVGLGTATLSGIERCLNRVDKPELLEMVVERMVENHIENYATTPTMLSDAMRATKPVMLQHISELNQDDSDTLYKIWHLFFEWVADLFLAKN